jgi:hypothetical protein
MAYIRACTSFWVNVSGVKEMYASEPAMLVAQLNK